MKSNFFKPVAVTFATLVLMNLFLIKANAISIGPDKYFQNIEDNNAVTKVLKIYADQKSSGPETLYLSVQNMVKVGEEDDRTFSDVDSKNPTQLANYIKLSQTQVIAKPGDIIDVSWTFTPNASLQCGTNLAAIVVSTNPNPTNNPDQGSVVSLNYRVISQVHFDINKRNGVACDNNDRLDFQSFTLDKSTPIFNYDGISFTTKIKNDGNIISRGPDGFIEIKGFGKKEVIQLNPKYLDIYPQTVRKFSNNWTDPDYPRDQNIFNQFVYELTHLKIGQYEATLTLSKNVPQPLSKSVTIWIIPWKVITFFLIILVVVILAVKILVGKLRSKNKKVVAHD